MSIRADTRVGPYEKRLLIRGSWGWTHVSIRADTRVGPYKNPPDLPTHPALPASALTVVFLKLAAVRSRSASSTVSNIQRDAAQLRGKGRGVSDKDHRQAIGSEQRLRHSLDVVGRDPVFHVDFPTLDNQHVGRDRRERAAT